jgi:hypothetical protein
MPFQRFKQRLEIALPEALIIPALDELKGHGPQDRRKRVAKLSITHILNTE